MPCRNFGFDSIDLRVHCLECGGQEVEGLARQLRYGQVRSHACQQAPDMRGALCLNQTELGQMPAQSIDQLGSLAHEQVASTMHNQHRLLLLAFERVAASQMAAASAASFFPRLR